MPDTLDEIAQWIAGARRGVGFTGAGISTESGIPDFRSPGGVWTRHDPRKLTFQRYLVSEEVRKEAWQMRMELWSREHAPNAGHRALTRLEQLGCLRGVITQNIDGLHQQAGSTVVELHGTMRTIACLSCSATWPHREVMKRLEAGEEDPRCTSCGGIIKAATVSFGQSIPTHVLDHAHEWSVSSDLCLVVGSSLVVYPACDLPLLAKRAGAKVVIVNREPTPVDSIADAVVNAEAGPTLQDLLGRVEALIGAPPG
ncbi:MAG TPA: NAD-dependent deacylase [Actinomycetota bacterium]|nr:NAD-dependent deacylase [Actinomycetota bacterium]